ncbi:hypothetical protein DFH07DRAFT_971788 [Mycena maculata]|uniref:Ubiquitin-like protease family profile domain-containing protein n=1 Tax=Mycena maculata TaxID=230809 RepID=A0AAD7HKZ8_9AGAR|nr:hypothetical protein DFH07DRAFT_971788 [Mycena maculata]
MAPGKKRSVHAHQPAARAGLGTHFKSPLKQRDTRKKMAVHGLGREQRAPSAQHAAPTVPVDEASDPDMEMADWVDTEHPSEPPSQPSPPPRPQERTGNAAQRLNNAWNSLLPALQGPWLQFYERTHGRQRDIIPEVKCLYLTHIQHVTVSTCRCKPVPVLLVEHGIFPASPTKTRMGVAIDVLDLYCALFERSCDAITALAAALHTIYERCGFKVLSGQASDPFRDLLIQVVQWTSNLRDRVEKEVAVALAQADSEATNEASESTGEASNLSSAMPSAPSAPSTTPSATSATPSKTSATSDDAKRLAQDVPPDAQGPSAPPPGPPPLKPGRADRILRERCPACFSLNEWGRPLNEGGDVQFGGDGCFSYRHLRKAGDGPISYDPNFFIPQHKVEAVAEKIKAARKRPSANVKPPVPQEVIDACEDSWDAANEKKRKADPKHYDASGIFVMTCRHGQVIFLCNVTTPGEQQCFIVAMLEEVFSLLPPSATVLQAYDVGCVTDHSLNLFPIFPPTICERITFIITECTHTDISLADHEGVERFWSLIRKLIPLTRGQWNSRRLWMIDQYAGFVSKEGRAGLGDWIHRQQRKSVTPKHRTAIRTLQECGVPLAGTLHNKKAAQISLRAHAPARLRRELDKVLLLQNQIDSVEKAIDETKRTLTGSQASPHPLAKTFPELRDLPLPFAQTLLVMRDLKMNIRKRAIGSFFEWESLDRAVSGRQEALGTKLHQSTRKAILKRQPSLLKAIKKFNAGCETLEQLHPPQCNIPLPSPLSTQLNGLRNDPGLHEDIWITPSEGPIPRWLNDEDVRDGIRSLHLADRCAEEVVRLNLEHDHLRRWLVEEQRVVTRAIEMTLDSPLTFLLRRRQEELLDLERSWAPSLRFQDADSHFVTESVTLATTFGASAAAFATSVAPSMTPSATSVVSAATPAGIPSTSSFSPIPIPRSTHLPHVVGAGLGRVPVVVEVDDFFEDAEEDEGTNGHELDPGTISDEDQANLIEEVLHESDEEDETETSTVDAFTYCLDVQWKYTPFNDIDTSFISELQTRNASLIIITGDFPHFISRTAANLGPLRISPEDWKPFQSLTGRLNGIGLNGVAASLHSLYSEHYSPTNGSATQCAVFSTYDLPCVRYKNSDLDLWRRVSPTQYWEKPVWLIPIHRPSEEHWVLVIVIVPSRELYFCHAQGSNTSLRGRTLRSQM